MKAIAIDGYGDPDKLQLVDMDSPPIAPDQVLVQVRAAGVNPIDWRLRNGSMQKFIPCEFPAILGREVAGVVVEIGNQVTQLAVGDEVYGFLQQSQVKWGSYAELVPADAHKLAHKPAALSFAQAAAVPVAFHTAQQGLFETAGLTAGETVLIHGGAGGVGVMAIQLAVVAGATVIATASPQNHEFLLGLGAETVVDYHHANFGQQLKKDYPAGVDVVFAPYAGQSIQASEPLVGQQTRIIILSPNAGPADMQIGPIKSELVVATADGKALESAAELFESGQIKVELAAVLPLADAAKAHQMSELGHTRGKIVLTP